MLDIEKLNYQERESYQKILDQYKTKQLSIEDIKIQVNNLLQAAVRELVEIENNQNEKNTYLKARVKNYLVLLDILTVPETVQKRLDEAVKALEKRFS